MSNDTTNPEVSDQSRLVRGAVLLTLAARHIDCDQEEHVMAAIHPASGEDIARLLEPGPPVPSDSAPLVVWLRGEHDLSTTARVAKVLADATAAGDGDVVVDLSRIEFMDAETVTVLIRCRQELRARSRDLFLRAPSWHARRILDLCGLLELIDAVPPIDADERDSSGTVRGPLARAPLGGRAVQAIPPIGRPRRRPPFARG